MGQTPTPLRPRLRWVGVSILTLSQATGRETSCGPWGTRTRERNGLVFNYPGEPRGLERDCWGQSGSPHGLCETEEGPLHPSCPCFKKQELVLSFASAFSASAGMPRGPSLFRPFPPSLLLTSHLSFPQGRRLRGSAGGTGEKRGRTEESPPSPQAVTGAQGPWELVTVQSLTRGLSVGKRTGLGFLTRDSEAPRGGCCDQ